MHTCVCSVGSVTLQCRYDHSWLNIGTLRHWRKHLVKGILTWWKALMTSCHWKLDKTRTEFYKLGVVAGQPSEQQLEGWVAHLRYFYRRSGKHRVNSKRQETLWTISNQKTNSAEVTEKQRIWAETAPATAEDDVQSRVALSACFFVARFLLPQALRTNVSAFHLQGQKEGR